MSGQQAPRKPREQRRKPFTAKDYRDELVLYGGEWMSRGDVIHDLDSKGFTPQERDVYLFGLDRYTSQIGAPAEEVGGRLKTDMVNS